MQTGTYLDVENCIERGCDRLAILTSEIETQHTGAGRIQVSVDRCIDRLQVLDNFHPHVTLMLSDCSRGFFSDIAKSGQQTENPANIHVSRFQSIRQLLRLFNRFAVRTCSPEPRWYDLVGGSF